MGLCVNCRAHGDMVEAAQKLNGEITRVLHHAKGERAKTLARWSIAIDAQLDAFIDACNFDIDCARPDCDSMEPKRAPKPSEVAGE